MIAEDDDEAANASSAITKYKIYEPGKSVVVGVYLTIVIVVSVVTNLVVILTMLQRRQRLKSTHVFVMSLAISDICFSVAIHPMLALTCFGVPARDIFSAAGCNWYGFGAMFFGCLSMLIHGTVGLTRYKNIVYPNDGRWRSLHFNLGLLSANIALSFGFAIAPVLGWGRFETFEYGCTVAFHDATAAVRSYVVVMLIFMLGLPLVSCVVCYTKITYFSYECKLQLFTLKSSPDSVGENSCFSSAHDVMTLNDLIKENGKESKNSLKGVVSLVDKKLTRLTVITAAGFIFAWSPFAILSIWETFYPPTEIPSAYRIVASLFCKSATAFNPFIYFFLSRGFRRDFYRLVRLESQGTSEESSRTPQGDESTTDRSTKGRVDSKRRNLTSTSSSEKGDLENKKSPSPSSDCEARKLPYFRT